MRKKFIFYDQKKVRLRKVGYFFLFFAVFLLTITYLFEYSINYYLKFDFQNAYKNRTLKETVDLISTREKEVINVDGAGPFVKLVEKEDGPYLERKPIEQPNRVILTFDDGPDPTYTPQILDKLKDLNIKAVFFVVGEQMVRYPQLVERIINEGHEIGVHSFYHPDDYAFLYDNPDRVFYEVDYPQKILIAQTGYKTNISRTPNWGAESTMAFNSLVFTVESADRGYNIIASTVDSLDWHEKNVDQIVKNATLLDGSQVILMHDGGGDRSVTVAAIDQIVRNYRNAGYEFANIKSVTDSTDYVMQKASFKELLIAKISYFSYWMKVYYSKILKGAFLTSLGITSIAIVLTVIFATTQYLREISRIGRKKMKQFDGFVSVLIPARNEENSIRKTVSSVLASDYLNFEVIVIDNGSIDDTSKKLKEFKGITNFKLVRENKAGKYAAINTGIKSSKGEIIVVIDADTQLLPDTLRKLVGPFNRSKIGAVAGNLKVGNLTNFLTKIQSIEYTIGLNLERRSYDLFGNLPVVPGALGAWRRKYLDQVGGLTPDTLAEDADLAIRIQRMGYKTAYVSDAIAFTEAPETIKDFIKQRQRWIYGILQVLYKHRDIYFKTQYGYLGALLLPYLGIIQTPFLFLGPLFDLVALITLFIFPQEVIVYFLIYLGINMILTIVAFIFAGESRWHLLIYVPVIRTYYQMIWYYNLYTCLVRIVQGVYIPWNKLNHKGSVEISGIEPSMSPDFSVVKD
jgi:cellulose synthase/poly-beta-1,6-N-acetylglucosamine synthase-like glycosyltransferase/peptidoglycan/xylan/chitin deacetylase (PgdA/CDA1 family)